MTNYELRITNGTVLTDFLTHLLTDCLQLSKLPSFKQLNFAKINIRNNSPELRLRFSLRTERSRLLKPQVPIVIFCDLKREFFLLKQQNFGTIAAVLWSATKSVPHELSFREPR